MIKPFDFYFDFVSPYSFLAHKEIRKIENKASIKIRYKPILLGGLHNLHGIKAPAFIPAKAKHMIRDCKLLAEKNNSYSITSNTQSQNADGNYEASGNVIISNETNFKGRSDKLFYEKDNSKIHLKGKVKIENYESGNILIEHMESDELILFTETGEFQVNSRRGNRVKTKLKF